jgi:hypothetical protein
MAARKPGYFDTIGTKIVEGRAINEQDTPTTRAVALVNRFFEKNISRMASHRKALQ